MAKMAYAWFGGRRTVKRYPVVESIETREDARFPASRGETVLGVFKGGTAVGYIRKFRDTPTESFPWQGFHYPMGFRCGPRLAGSYFYENAKDKAIRAVLEPPV